MASYEVRVYDTNFQLKQVINDWFEFHLVEALNEMNEVTLIIDANKTKQVQDLETLDAIIEVIQWFPPDSNRRIQSHTLHRFPQESIPIDTKNRYTSHSVGLEDFLERRAILYRQGDTAHSTVTAAPVETAMKFFANLNVGPGATVGPRLFNGVQSNFVIEHDSAYGPLWTGQRGLQNLYSSIQEISKSGQVLPDGTLTTVDFGVEWNKADNTFVFKVYKPFRGTDRHETIELSQQFNTAYNMNYNYDRRKEANAIIVMGKGDEATRPIIEVRDDTLINESPWNRREITADDTTDTDVAALTAYGQSKITSVSQLETFTCDLLDTGQVVYGRDYFLGDIIRLRVGNRLRAKRITAMQTDVVEGVETKRITCTDFPSTRNINQLYRTLASRTAKLETRGHQ